MAKLTWDNTGEKFYEMGTDRGVLFVKKPDGTYNTGVAWNGLISVAEQPSGAEETKLYADNIKYASLMSAEEFGATIEAYTYPEEWAQCDGSQAPADGVYIGQQTRIGFGFAYRTQLGNDISDAAGYKIHLVYDCKASPSEKSYSTINDSPEAITFSWTIVCTPVSAGTYKPTYILTIDSTKVDETKLAAFEEILYGGTSTEARLPLPDEVITLFTA